MAQQCSTHEGQRPAIQQQKIVIDNDHGEKLVGVLHDTGSTEVVILCHGFRSSKGVLLSDILNHTDLFLPRHEYNALVNLAAALGKERISAFRFDFAGNGESEGSFQYGNYRREVEDLRAVILHFRQAKRVIIAIVGHSKGGNVVLLYASKFHDVPTVINFSGRFNLGRGIEGRLGKKFMQIIKENGFIDVKDKTGNTEYRVTETSLLDRLTTDMHEACISINKDCRVLTVHGSMDEMVPVKDALEFAKVIPNHKLHIIDGADHLYTRHQAELVLVVLDFIKSGMKQNEATPNNVPSCQRRDKFINSRF